jgi:hypothetical protein
MLEHNKQLSYSAKSFSSVIFDALFLPDPDPPFIIIRSTLESRFARKTAFYGKHKIYPDILRNILFNIAQRELDHNLSPLEGKSSKKPLKR